MCIFPSIWLFWWFTSYAWLNENPWTMLSMEVSSFWTMVPIVLYEDFTVWHVSFLYSKVVDLLLMYLILFLVMALWCVDMMKKTKPDGVIKSIRLCAQRPLEGWYLVPSYRGNVFSRHRVGHPMWLLTDDRWLRSIVLYTLKTIIYIIIEGVICTYASAYVRHAIW